MSRPLHVLTLLLAAVFVAAVVRLAWLCDDAYITLRTVENAIAGDGLVWNVGERVQTYTHPLWMFVLLGARAVVGHHYLAAIGASMAAAFAGAWLLARLAGARGMIVVVLLLISHAYMDFTTSGLETPLTMLLLALLATVHARTPVGQVRPRAIAFVIALLGVTRLDLLALAGPLLLAHVRLGSLRRDVAAAAVGLAPLVGWCAFASFYYGSPLPITAHAKAISNGLPAGALFEQGLRYLADSWRRDPATLATIALGCGIATFVPSLRARWQAFGIVAYVFYIVKVGGDFMSGRFFVPPLVVAIAVLARVLGADLRFGRWCAAVIVAGSVTATIVAPMAWLMPDVVGKPEVVDGKFPDHGIVDERRFYYPARGLLSTERIDPAAGEASQTILAGGWSGTFVAECWNAGVLGFEAGRKVHLVDRHILDPLLMRLPMVPTTKWRVGHLPRAIPEGYLESLACGRNRIVHPGLHAYYEDLRTTIRAPLFDVDRLAAVWRLWMGAELKGLKDYIATDYLTPPLRELAASDAEQLADKQGAAWFDCQDPCVIGRGGVQVELPAHAGQIQLLGVIGVTYHVQFMAGTRVLGETTVMVGDDRQPLPGDRLGVLRRLVGLNRADVIVPPLAGGVQKCRITTGLRHPYQTPAFGGLRVLP